MLNVRFPLSALVISFSPFLRSTILQQQFNRVGRVEHGSVALPGIIRSGSVGGPDTYNMGTMPSAQQQVTTGQMHRGHMPPLVRAGISRLRQTWLHSISELFFFTFIKTPHLNSVCLKWWFFYIEKMYDLKAHWDAHIHPGHKPRVNICFYFPFLFCAHYVSLSCCGPQSLAQQALMGTINSSMQAVQQAQADLGYVDNPPPLGHDLVTPFDYSKTCNFFSRRI